MHKEEKHIKNNDDQLVQYYLEELSLVKLLDRHTLRKVHTKLETGAYFKSNVFDSITDSILEEKIFN